MLSLSPNFGICFGGPRAALKLYDNDNGSSESCDVPEMTLVLEDSTLVFRRICVRL